MVAASKPDQVFCSVVSIEAQEQLIGTAPRADAWFLLEYPGRWGNKALKESTIPEEVKAFLNAQLDLIPESRLLLIKQSPAEHGGISFFAAISKADQPALYRFQLKDYEELLDLDLTAVASQDTRFDAARIEEPVFVMCTNGLRDQCCALHGMATYRALAKSFPGKIWESTHHGGHRFAANLLHLPNGISYGRLRPESAPEVLQMALEKRIAFYHYRGRTIYSEAVQAAEALLRQGIGIEGVDALTLQRNEDLGDGKWRVQFAGVEDVFEIVIRREETGAQVQISCDDELLGWVVEYSLVENPSAVS
ncbi:MAG: sucrase ferredoxin [Anaerolineales bacterium]